MPTEKNEAKHAKHANGANHATRTKKPIAAVEPAHEPEVDTADALEGVDEHEQLRESARVDLHNAIYEGCEVVIRYSYNCVVVVANGGPNRRDAEDYGLVRGTVCKLDNGSVVVLMRNGRSERLFLSNIVDVEQCGPRRLDDGYEV
ncbi:MAG: hypothetical protein KF795_15500 [Labilithrix sp.]|nr:hypothetical protein [Labilithrix sp.]